MNPFSDDFFLYTLFDILHINDFLEFIFNFFSNLLDFVIHLVLPTDSQWQQIKNDFINLNLSIENHLPFISFIKSTISDVQNTNIINNDFLIISVPRVTSFDLFNGIETETRYINVMQAYEPYRIQIRGLLCLIVYGMAFVYIVKRVTGYGTTNYHIDNKDI